MKYLRYIVPCLFSLAVIAGCAATKVSDQQSNVNGPLPRPDNVLVYDFVATPDEVPPDSALAGQYSEQSTPQTAEQMAMGRQLGYQ